jgi:hypothetical protein
MEKKVGHVVCGRTLHSFRSVISRQNVSVESRKSGLKGSRMKVNLEGIELNLAHPDELNVTWVGQEEAMRQLMAAWLVLDRA